VNNHFDKMPDGVDSRWTPRRLRRVLDRELGSLRLIVVSNRQPYSHEKLAGGQIAVKTSAGGLVTAIAPVMRACSGVWVAHGSGSADRETVDIDDRVWLPPDAPTFALRRVWLSADEQKLYYEGFSNEGLWPLCHTTPVRPKFRRTEWLAYKQVNRRFRDAVFEERGISRPMLFVQDYHLALLPQFLREVLPSATIALFWHIPWPTPQRLVACPWWRVIVRHMLGSDVLGLNTNEDCTNFLSAASRLSRFVVDQSSGAVIHGTRVCRVFAYPESIEWNPRFSRNSSAKHSHVTVRKRYGISPTVRLGLSVDRCDFTKGIPERLLAVERLFETSPQWRGKFTLLQISVPSRSNVPAYRELQAFAFKEVQRINARFATPAWTPVVLVQEEQEREYLYTLYRSADIFLVNSLHDGMNLVAKEFVAARHDEDGVLILSRRAGAAHELIEALLIDPLDICASAIAIEVALRMPREERRIRMRRMRTTVEHNNVYKWAGHIISDAAKARRIAALRHAGPIPR
jgi:trehalose-6-phosphate synthase